MEHPIGLIAKLFLLSATGGVRPGMVNADGDPGIRPPYLSGPLPALTLLEQHD
jgi:hypothetical protein